MEPPRTAPTPITQANRAALAIRRADQALTRPVNVDPEMLQLAKEIAEKTTEAVAADVLCSQRLDLFVAELGLVLTIARNQVLKMSPREKRLAVIAWLRVCGDLPLVDFRTAVTLHLKQDHWLPAPSDLRKLALEAGEKRQREDRTVINLEEARQRVMGELPAPELSPEEQQARTEQWHAITADLRRRLSRTLTPEEVERADARREEALRRMRDKYPGSFAGLEIIPGGKRETP